MKTFIEYLFFLLCSFGIVFFTGYLLTRLTGFSQKGTYVSYFLWLISGLCLVVICASVYFTKGKTINIGILIMGLILLIYHFKYNRNQRLAGPDDQKKKNSFFIQLLMVFLVLGSIYTFRFFQIYNPGSIFLIPNPDTLFYANVSNYLGVSGVENISLDYLGIFPKSNDPYHYFDIWVNAAVVRIFHLNALKSYVLITIPLLVTTCWFGLMAIAERFVKVNVLIQLLAFSFLFFSGIYLPFYKEIHLLENSNVFTTDLLSYPKLNPIFLFFVGAVLFFIYQRQKEGLWVLLVIPFVFISTSISLYTAIFVFLLIRFLRGRNLAVFIKSVIPLMLVAMALFCFYTVSQENQVFKIQKVKGGIFSLLQPGYIKTCINIVGLTCIQLVVLFLPVFLVVFPARKLFKSVTNILHADFFLLTILIFIISLSGWASLHYMPDTVQLFSNISVVMLAILFFVFVVFLLEKVSSVHKAAIYLVFAFIFVFKLFMIFKNGRETYTQSPGYLRQTSEAISGINPRGVYFLNDSSYSNVFSKNPIFNIMGRHLAYANSDAFTYSLSVYNTPVFKPAENDTVSMSHAVFYYYVEKQKMNGSFRSLASSQLEFIHDYHVQYMLVERGAKLDKNLTSLISSEITDPWSGDHFYLIDSEKAMVHQTH